MKKVLMSVLVSTTMLSVSMVYAMDYSEEESGTFSRHVSPPNLASADSLPIPSTSEELIKLVTEGGANSSFDIGEIRSVVHKIKVSDYALMLPVYHRLTYPEMASFYKAWVLQAIHTAHKNGVDTTVFEARAKRLAGDRLARWQAEGMCGQGECWSQMLGDLAKIPEADQELFVTQVLTFKTRETTAFRMRHITEVLSSIYGEKRNPTKEDRATKIQRIASTVQTARNLIAPTMGGSYKARILEAVHAAHNNGVDPAVFETRAKQLAGNRLATWQAEGADELGDYWSKMLGNLAQVPEADQELFVTQVLTFKTPETNVFQMRKITEVLSSIYDEGRNPTKEDRATKTQKIASCIQTAHNLISSTMDGLCKAWVLDAIHTAHKNGVDPTVFESRAKQLAGNRLATWQVAGRPRTGLYWSQMLGDLAQVLEADQELFVTQVLTFKTPETNAFQMKEITQNLSRLSADARRQYTALVRQGMTTSQRQKMIECIPSYTNAGILASRIQAAYNAAADLADPQGVIDTIRPIMMGWHAHQQSTFQSTGYVDRENVENQARRSNTRKSLGVLYDLTQDHVPDLHGAIAQVRALLEEKKNAAESLTVKREGAGHIVDAQGLPVNEIDNALRALDGPGDDTFRRLTQHEVVYGSIADNHQYVTLDSGFQTRGGAIFARVWHLVNSYSYQGDVSLEEEEISNKTASQIEALKTQKREQITAQARQNMRLGLLNALAACMDEVEPQGKRVCENGKAQRLLSVLQGYYKGIQIDEAASVHHVLKQFTTETEALVDAEEIRTKGLDVANTMYPQDVFPIERAEFLDGVNRIIQAIKDRAGME